MLAGLSQASGDAVAIMDADLQHPPRLIARMLPCSTRATTRSSRAARATGDAPCARLPRRAVLPRGQPHGRRRPRGRRRRLPGPVPARGARAARARRVQPLLQGPVLLDRLRHRDRRLRERRPRGRRDQVAHAATCVNYGIDSVFSFNSRPLRMAIHLGAFVSAMCVRVRAVGSRWRQHCMATRPRAMSPPFARWSVFGGLQMIILGVIGEYIGRIYAETKARPHFLLKESSEGQRPRWQLFWGRSTSSSCSRERAPRARWATQSSAASDPAAADTLRRGRGAQHRNILRLLPAAPAGHSVHRGPSLRHRYRDGVFLLSELLHHLQDASTVAHLPAVPFVQRGQHLHHDGWTARCRAVVPPGRADCPTPGRTHRHPDHLRRRSCGDGWSTGGAQDGSIQRRSSH